MTIEEAIKKAIDAGYNPIEDSGNEYKILLDPQFWQCLGKSLGWAEEKFYQFEATHPYLGDKLSEAQWHSRCFMNHIWEGKSVEEYFKTLI